MGEPPLVGTEWQLASYRGPGAEAPVAVRADSTLSLSATGSFTARAGNRFGGPATVDAERISFEESASTARGCTGELMVLDGKVAATLRGSARWAIRGGVLTLAGADGHVLTYRVRPSIYPSLTARTILAGDRAGGQYRLAVEGHFLVFEYRTAPGERWNSAGHAAPRPGDDLAGHVLGAGELGGETFLAAWATPDVAKVTSDAADTDLPLHVVPGSTLRIAGRWVADFRPGVSVVTFLDRGGAVLARYPAV